MENYDKYLVLIFFNIFIVKIVVVVAVTVAMIVADYLLYV